MTAIIIFIASIAFTGICVYALFNAKRMSRGGKVKAVVNSCTPSVMRLMGQDIPCYELSIEIPTEYGVPTYKNIKDNRSYNVGETVDVYYDSKSDKVDFEKNLPVKNMKGLYIAIAFGVFMMLMCILALMIQSGGDSANSGKEILAFVTVILFIVIGGFLIFVRGSKRKKQMSNAQEVTAVMVEYETYRKDRTTMYRPIFEYTHNGQVKRYRSPASGNMEKYRQIGRTETLYVDNLTGMVSSKSVLSTEKVFGWMFFLIGLGLASFIIVKAVSGDDIFEENPNDDSAVNNEAEADFDNIRFNSEGYSNDVLEMPKEERYSEYSYTSTDEDETYSYTVTIYQYGLGQVIIFPNTSTGKPFEQYYSFEVDYSHLKNVINDAKEYDFQLLADDEDGDADAYEYLYYYDGKNKNGSGGKGIVSSDFEDVTSNIKACVPDAVWEAIEKEMKDYYGK